MSKSFGPDFPSLRQFVQCYNLKKKSKFIRKNFILQIQVFRHDKSPVMDLSRLLTLKYSSNEQFDDVVSKDYRIDENGQFEWTVKIPMNYSQLYVKV